MAVGSDVFRSQHKRFFAVECQHLGEWNTVILMADFHVTAATSTNTQRYTQNSVQLSSVL